MASKILPDAVKKAIRRNFLKRKPKAKRQNPTGMPADALSYFREQGRIGGKKSTKNREAARRSGEGRIRKICQEMGYDYDALPDAPVEQPKT